MRNKAVTDFTLLPVILTIRQTASVMGMSYDWTQKLHVPAKYLLSKLASGDG